MLNGGERSPWNLIDEAVGNALPRSLWSELSIREIKAEAIQQELIQNGQADSIDTRSFSRQECTDLLGDVKNDDLWTLLPLHWSFHGYPVSASGEDVYLGEQDLLDEKLLTNIHLIAKSKNTGEASRQQRILKSLNEEGRLGVLLASGEPGQYWSNILDLLAVIKDQLNEQLLFRVRNTAWVPADNGIFFEPLQIIDLTDRLEELDWIYEREPKRFCLPHHLLPAFRDHQTFGEKFRGLFSREQSGLIQLAKVLDSQDDYQVGDLKIDTSEQLERISSVMSQTPRLGWALLHKILSFFEAETVFEILWPAMSGAIELPDLLSIMSSISDCGPAGEAEHEAFNTYLKFFAENDQAGNYLQNLHLLNQVGEWQPAGKLVSGAEGIAPVHLLDIQQAKLLSRWIRDETNTPSRSQTIENPDSALLPDAAGGVLRDYFEPWSGRVLDQLIAALLILVGRDKPVRELTAEYLGHHSVDWLIEQLPWQVPKIPYDRNSANWLEGCSRNEALNKFRVAIVVMDKSETTIDSILGKPIKVALDDQFKSLFIGQPYERRLPDKTYFIALVIRKLDPANFSDDILTSMIKNSVRYLLGTLYNQPKPILGGLWAELDKSDQVDIELARSLILDNIPFYLKLLGSHKHPELDARLHEFDIARKQVAEFRGKEKEQEFELKQKKMLRGVQQLLESDTTVQQSVLDAIRAKVRDYQYQHWSIPFEVFQNADDAVYNLEEIEAWPSRPGDPGITLLPREYLKFVVVEESERVSFLHWGRAINQIGSAGFPGKERKFDNDLENMVILSASDKGDDVTGKFGLGFKSVLLVSDTPEIISGRLHTRIIGGLLPAVWTESQGVQKLLRQHQTSKQRGTAISLPLREGVVDTGFLDPFIQRSGVLVAFSKKIREIKISRSNGMTLRYKWEPREIAGIKGIDTGLVQLGVDVSQRVLKMDLGEGAVLLGLDSDGFTELPPELPNIWVMAPVSESDSLGYAINGTFEIDAGRSRLAADSDINRFLGKQLGNQMERHLKGLFNLNLLELKQSLQIQDSISAYELWYSLWKTLLGKLTRIAHESGVRVIAQPLVTDALGRLAGSKSIVPNGLPGELGCLLKWHDINFIFKGVLAQPDLLRALGGTRFFGNHLKTDRAISDDVATWLGVVVPEFRKTSDQWISRGFADLLGSISFKEGVSPQDATLLGKAFNSTTRDRLLPGGKVLLDDFDNSIKLLADIRFQSTDGGSLHAGELLTKAGSDDEKRRCGFAPSSHLLAPGYDDRAVQFFLLCRGKFEARSEVLSKWILEAQTDESREAALLYLLKGELGSRVAKYLLDGNITGTWISGVDESSPLLAQWEYPDKRELIHKVLVTSKEIKGLRFEQELEEDTFEPIDPVTALDAIYSWWHQEQEELLEDYARNVYPREIELNFEDDQEGRFDRSSWLSLLLLGGFHTLGKFKPQQHRGFIEDCQRRNWWRVFSEEHPEQRFHEWMQVLDEFITAQIDTQQYEYWMLRFPVIYKLSRYLDEYAELFFGLDRYSTNIKLSNVLSPWADENQQGGGIGAPALGKSLGIGSNFVVRELLRHGVLKSNLLAQHAYVPHKSVCDLMRNMGCVGLDPKASMENAPRIYEFISRHMDEDKVSFDNAWDIPLMIVADDWSLQQELLGREMTVWDEVDNV